VASIYFAKTTETAAWRLYADRFIAVASSTRLELLLEQHRRIVESSPAELERARLDRSRAELEEIGNKLVVLIGDLISESSRRELDGAEKRIGSQLPDLFRLGDRVIFFAHEFAQDSAVESASDYATVADDIQRQIRRYREARLKDAQEAVSDLLSTASSLTIWVWICAILAFTLIGPIGLMIMHGVLSRLNGVTQALVKLAHRNTSVDVPSRSDGDEVGEMARAVEVFKDSTIKLMAREIELAQVNRRLDVALNNMTHGLCMFDVERRLIVCNDAYVRMYGLPRELAKPGTSLRLINNHRLSVGNSAIASPEQIATESAVQSPNEPPAFMQELVDGRTIAVSQRWMPGGGWVAVHEDITERRRVEAKIAFLARHDVLTNLPNRVLFRERLDEEFSRLTGEHTFAVLCLDLDRFKQVNDSHGHAFGDELLKRVADRLRSCVNESGLVARIGGDEFAIVQVEGERPEHFSHLAQCIVEVLSEPYDIDGKHIVIGTSVGIAIAPVDGSTPDQLLKNADMALYLAKGNGRGTHHFFEAEMDRRLRARRALEIDLRSAIGRGDFDMHYQPIVRLETNKINGFEALLRWDHPIHGPIPPLDFIPVAEETGLILPLGEWVLRTACKDAVSWSEPIDVSINLSPAQFKSGSLVRTVLSALAGSGLSPKRLILEITESVFLQNETRVIATLHQLRELGVRIALDDFGTGYSSLAYLRSFPFDKIKIDRSFVRDILEREDCRAIVGAVTELARKLKMITVVEGVETQAQLDIVTAQHCDECQGFLFGAAVPQSGVLKHLLACKLSSAA
jgi:diguanylate cyclase (GGDEF)-like protein